MNEPPRAVIPPQFDEATRRARLAFLDFGERDEPLLHELEGLFREHLPEITERFYRHLLRFEATRRLLKDEAQVARLKEAQGTYLLESVRGPWDAGYFERRWRVGWTHNELHLQPTWFIGAFQLYRSILIPLIVEQWADDIPAAMEHLLALDKVLNLDLQLGIESYYVHYESTMERLRELNVQIRAASAARSQFLANMSHEFRTPLNAIIGFTEMLEDQQLGPLNPAQQESLGDIHQAGEALVRLISDVLDLAKIEAGRLELFPERFSAAQALREVVTTMRPMADRKGLTLEARLAPELGSLSADQTRFKQVVYNLLSNAVKFTDRGGITVTAELAQGGLHLAVKDTGIGVKPENLPLLFVEFSQVDASHARRYEGTGLGLALSRRLTEAHGGRIWVESVFDQGSTFHVWFPLQPPGKEG